MSACIKCGLPAVAGSNFCGLHQDAMDGDDVVYLRDDNFNTRIGDGGGQQSSEEPKGGDGQSSGGNG